MNYNPKHDPTKHHTLKIVNPYYDDVRRNVKNFEIRKDDRDYKLGDMIHFCLYDKEKDFVHDADMGRVVKYILRDAEQYGLKEGYCILGF